ncbi:crotonase/enoyl-CoA hydratase family protein [Sphingobium algorifonticola]|uniref:Crotonase/enoyl-CoA hydratase family protein n=1 Tax=Sphingobium algorifonticola TaxID=2008318 RepID=A0A437JC90_9SPHN|nr:crotonase/enoyl-CoA hydratase family protein [Sphingobium algorifonticola]RVT43556.1 crotonase/enoyl-CoA hydratase family protein [Sphingobium algorifonticola]
MTDQSDRITLTVDGGIADLRLNRPDKMNAFDGAQFLALSARITEIAARRDIRCVVLSGEGRAFSVGVDLQALAGAAELRDLMPRTHGQANLFQHCAWGLRALPMPVIAAVHGYAFGAGCQVMLGADIRIARPDMECAMMEIRWGIVPDMGGIALLRDLVRGDVAREMIFTGRRISGTEAAALGLVTQLADDPFERAMAIARGIAASSPDAIRAAKRLLDLPRGAEDATILLEESREQAALMRSANHREALAAGLEKRAPHFAD